jgi:hypothetical protein
MEFFCFVFSADVSDFNFLSVRYIMTKYICRQILIFSPISVSGFKILYEFNFFINLHVGASCKSFYARTSKSVSTETRDGGSLGSDIQHVPAYESTSCQTDVCIPDDWR